MHSPHPIMSALDGRQHRAVTEAVEVIYDAWMVTGKSGSVYGLLRQVAELAVAKADAARDAHIREVLADPDFDPFAGEGSGVGRELVGAR